MQQIYSVLIALYGFTIRVAAVFDSKAALWVKGRKQYWTNVEKALADPAFANSGRKLAWFHCASLGEFEQGRPIMEAFKEKYPNYKIVLTFFSPSGFEVRKSYTGADLILYLPLDTQANAKRFIDLINPDIVFYIKYEFWFNFLNYIQIKKIPLFLVSAVFRADQHFFKGYGEWPRKILKGFTRIFVQDENSVELLQFIGIENVEKSGDTRFDRVSAIAAAAQPIVLAEAFAHNHQVLVAGSSWPADEDLLVYLMEKDSADLKLIIAPHEVDTESVKQLFLKFRRNAVLFSETSLQEAKNAKVLIIDSIGMLSQLYQYGKLAYIGGGFGAGIHNILEAAAYGLPVMFGPNYHKFVEARELIGNEGAFEIQNKEQLDHKVRNLLSNGAELEKASSANRNYVHEGKGATQRIMRRVDEILQG